MAIQSNGLVKEEEEDENEATGTPTSTSEISVNHCFTETVAEPLSLATTSTGIDANSHDPRRSDIFSKTGPTTPEQSDGGVSATATTARTHKSAGVTAATAVDENNFMINNNYYNLIQ
jgi:hypothetical protein